MNKLKRRRIIARRPFTLRRKFEPGEIHFDEETNLTTSSSQSQGTTTSSHEFKRNLEIQRNRQIIETFGSAGIRLLQLPRKRKRKASSETIDDSLSNEQFCASNFESTQPPNNDNNTTTTTKASNNFISTLNDNNNNEYFKLPHTPSPIKLAPKNKSKKSPKSPKKKQIAGRACVKHTWVARMSNVKINEWIEMRVMLRDRNNLPTNVGGQISITIKGCGKISCKLTPSKSLESCIKIIYLVSKKGKYSLDIRLDGEPITSFTINAEANPAKKSSVNVQFDSVCATARRQRTRRHTRRTYIVTASHQISQDSRVLRRK